MTVPSSLLFTLQRRAAAAADVQLTDAALPPLRVGVVAKWQLEEAACMTWCGRGPLHLSQRLRNGPSLNYWRP